MGRKKLCGMLRKLPAVRPLELRQASIDVFPWRLWLPTCATREYVVGIGTERLAIMHTSAARAGYTSGTKLLNAHADTQRAG